MAKKKVLPALESVLKPDFSGYVEDGKFEAVDALECHINDSKLYLSAAIALLEGYQGAGDAQAFIRLAGVALERGIEEAYRVRDLVKAA